jgi:hypothetical protein
MNFRRKLFFMQYYLSFCHLDDYREEKSRVHQVSVTEILRYALDDKKKGSFFVIFQISKDLFID